MNLCLICQNKTDDSSFKTICIGCISLLNIPISRCRQCGVELQHQQDKCGACLKSPPFYSQVFYVTGYQAPIDKWVMSLKFGDKIILSRLFAELMGKNLSKIDKDFILMSVPLHKSRLRKRGYNQAYEITKEISKNHHLELNTSLIRTKNTQMQAQLKFKERIKNVKNAFKLKENISIKKVLLIDDVMTTGNTINECAKTLKKAGVEDVKVMVFARKLLSQ